MVKKNKKNEFKKFTIECPKGHMPVCKKIRLKKRVQKLIKQLPKEEGNELMKIYQREIREQREARDASFKTSKAIKKLEGSVAVEKPPKYTLQNLKEEAQKIGKHYDPEEKKESDETFQKRKKAFGDLKKKSKLLGDLNKEQFENYVRINFDDDG